MEDKIVINGTTYYKEKSKAKHETLEFEPFEYKEYIKGLNMLKKIFGWNKGSGLTQEEAFNREFCCKTDPSNVMYIEALSFRAKDLLRLFIDKDDLEKKPKVSYKPEQGIETTETIVSNMYLRNAMDLLTHAYTDKSPRISSMKDYPLRLRNDDFEIIIAPRIEGDEDWKK